MIKRAFASLLVPSFRFWTKLLFLVSAAVWSSVPDCHCCQVTAKPFWGSGLAALAARWLGDWEGGARRQGQVDRNGSVSVYIYKPGLLETASMLMEEGEAWKHGDNKETLSTSFSYAY